MPGLDDFQLRLVQWLLDQLNSRKELETVSQQISVLISQAQEQSLEDLYAHIGTLIFQRAIGKGPETCIQPCAELCHSLSVAHLKRRLSLSPRVTLVHDHIFRFCLDSICTGNALEPANATSLSNDNAILAERSSKLLFNLWDFQLVSIVQICEYIFRVIEAHKTSAGPKLTDAVATVRFLLQSCFPNRSYGHWENEVNLFHEWIDSCSSPSETETNAVGLGDLDRINEVNAASQAGHTVIEHTNHSPLEPNAEGTAFNTSDAAPPKEAPHLPQSPVYDEEIMDNMTRNNRGKPPQSPSASVAKRFEDARSKGRGVLIDATTGMEHTRASSIVFTSESTLEDVQGQSAKDTKGVTSVPTPSKSATATPSARSTSPATAATSSGTAPIPRKQKKVNVHALFNPHLLRSTSPSPGASVVLQGGGEPPFTATPSIATKPSKATPAQSSADSNKPRQDSSASGGQQPAGSPRMIANVPLQHPTVHPDQHHPAHPMQPPPQWGPAGYYYPPPDYNPYMYWGAPQHQHMPQIHQPRVQPSPRTQPAHPRPPSTPPVPNNASPHSPPHQH